MSLKINIPESELMKPRIVIFGAGGAGGNAVNNMIRSSLEGVEFVAANTDAQALSSSLADNKIQLGVKTTKGLGAGSFPDRGKMAAEENLEEIAKYLDGSNMVFIAAGMGGGTGTGAAPVIAKLAKERDILTVGVVTKPFHFEGKYRMETAEKGIEELKKHVDTLIIIPNQNLFRIANENTTFESAFKMADDVLHAGVRGITDLITMPGLVNLDFADIRTIMTKMGKAMMGTGEASGEDRAILACEAAISNPLLDDISIKGAKGVLVNMTGGPDMTLFEADMAVNAIKKEVDPNANIIFGSAFNENMKGKIRISVVATGIDVDDYKKDITKTQESHEPSRFKAGADKEKTGKNFFDPGISLKPKEEIFEEIEEVSFQQHSPLKEDAHKESYNEHRKLKKDPEPIKQTNLFDDEDIDEDQIIEEIIEEVRIIEEKKYKKPEKYIKPTTKESKESSGFSLFGFMNSGKKQKNDNFTLDEEDFEDDIRQENPVKPMNSDKKSKSFANATIFDDEIEEFETREKSDDDILNVPAFFRRKK